MDFIPLAFFLPFFVDVIAQCNICSEFNIMCVGSSQYKVCQRDTGEAVSSAFSCPTNQICSTVASPSSPCIDRSDLVLPDCLCGYCANQFFACISETQFQICLDKYTLTGPILDCPSGTNCDAYLISGTYCSADSAPLQCPKLTTTTTTPTPTISTKPPTEVTTFIPISTTPGSSSPCKEVGKFPTPNTSCVKYYSCAFLSGKWIYMEYSCTGNAHFDPKTERCSLTYVCPETN